MKTLRLASKTAFLAFLSATLIMVPIVGCNVDQVVAAIGTAADVALQAGGIVNAVNPQFGAIITAVGGTLKDLSDLYAQYEAAPESDKTNALAKIRTALNIATANLSTILADSRIKAPGLQREIGVFVAVANSAISLIIAHIPKNKSLTGDSAAMTSKRLPIVANAKTPKDLKKAWNDAVQQNHPEAVIR